MTTTIHINMELKAVRFLPAIFALTFFFHTPILHAQTLTDSLRQAINAMEYHPDSADLRLKKAAFNMQLGQWQLAKDEYDVVLRLYPDNLAALYYRAYANRQLHRYHFSRLDYQHLLRLVPRHFEAQLGLALLNQEDHRYSEAYEQLSLLVGQYPDSATVYAARANLEVEREQYEAAEWDYSEALRLQPQNSDWLLARADVRIRLCRFSDAISDLDTLADTGTPRAALMEYYKRAGMKRKNRRNK